MKDTFRVLSRENTALKEELDEANGISNRRQETIECVFDLLNFPFSYTRLIPSSLEYLWIEYDMMIIFSEIKLNYGKK